MASPSSTPAGESDRLRSRKFTDAIFVVSVGIRPFLDHVLRHDLHSRVAADVEATLGSAEQCPCGNANFLDQGASGKRTPNFREKAKYTTPMAHIERCEVANCPGRDTGLPCGHRLAEYARKKIDPAYVTPGGPTECGCEAWAAAIQRYHLRVNTLNRTLANCDPTKWATSPWEVGKAYVSGLGEFNIVDNQPEDSILAKVSADDFDPAALFILPQRCLAFQGATVTLPNGSSHTFPAAIDTARWKAATKARNHTLGHTVRMGLDEAPYNKAMTTLKDLLDDKALHTRGEPYVDKVEWAQKQLNWIRGASAAEMEDRCITQITEARDYASHRRRAVTFLTAEQADVFLAWRDKTWLRDMRRVGQRVVPRWLVQASSGTGKTAIAVKMAAMFILDGVPTHDFEERRKADSDSDDHSFLLLAHSESLVHGVLLPDLLATLEFEREFFGPHTVARRSCQHRSGKIDEYFEVSCANAPRRAVVVCSADVLMLEHTQWSCRFGDVVVDEGHVVFSYQPCGGLDGQHVAEDPVEVVRALERTMCGENGGMSNLVIFHDSNYQPAGAVRPPFEAFLAEPKLDDVKWDMLKIVRNPGPVRDCSVPFSTELQTKHVNNGEAKFFPLFREGLPAEAVRRVNVLRGPYRGNSPVFNLAQKLLLKKKSLVRLKTECSAQTGYYAEALSLELERIRKDWADVDGAQLGSAHWEQHVAVMAPGVPEPLPAELLCATLTAAVAKGLIAVAAALRRVSVSVVDTATMYFGAVENMAGLERAVVVVTGMEHPSYAMYRVEHEGWEDEHSRVDPRVYLAITRCTAELVVVETAVDDFARHFGISTAMQPGSDGMAPFVGSRAKSTEAARAFVEPGGNTLGLQAVVNPEKPPPPSTLVNAVSIQLKHREDNWLDRERWASSAFRWSQCERGIRELFMANQLKPTLSYADYSSSGGANGPAARAVEATSQEDASRELLTDLGVFELADLEVLWMGGNQLCALPGQLGQLSKLHELHLGINNLGTHGVPAEIAHLQELGVLALDCNRLSSVPPAIFQLTKLTKLRLNNNQLTALPAEIALLKSLTSLELHDNMLESLPPQIGLLTAMQTLSADHNRLRCVPPEIGDLSELRFLSLTNNQLEVLPNEIGRLCKLAGLKLDRNRLRALPAGIGQLAALASLGLSQNLLEELPDFGIGQLPMLSKLSVYNNQLETLPKGIGHCGELSELSVNGNRLTLLPSEIGQLTKLEGLWLQNNLLSCLPSSIGGLSELTLLHLGSNPLTNLPEELGRLKLSSLSGESVEGHQTELGMRLAGTVNSVKSGFAFVESEGTRLFCPLSEVFPSTCTLKAGDRVHFFAVPTNKSPKTVGVTVDTGSKAKRVATASVPLAQRDVPLQRDNRRGRGEGGHGPFRGGHGPSRGGHGPSRRGARVSGRQTGRSETSSNVDGRGGSRGRRSMPRTDRQGTAGHTVDLPVEHRYYAGRDGDGGGDGGGGGGGRAPRIVPQTGPQTTTGTEGADGGGIHHIAAGHHRASTHQVPFYTGPTSAQMPQLHPYGTRVPMQYIHPLAAAGGGLGYDPHTSMSTHWAPVVPMGMQPMQVLGGAPQTYVPSWRGPSEPTVSTQQDFGCDRPASATTDPVPPPGRSDQRGGRGSAHDEPAARDPATAQMPRGSMPGRVGSARGRGDSARGRGDPMRGRGGRGAGRRVRETSRGGDDVA